LLGLAQRDRHHAILERQRRKVDGIILEPEALDAKSLGEAIRLDKWRAADLRANGGLAVERQQLAVAPHVRGSPLDLAAADGLSYGLVIVIDLERPKIVGAEVEGLFGVGFATQTTFQTANKIGRHVLLLEVQSPKYEGQKEKDWSEGQVRPSSLVLVAWVG